MKKTLLPMMLLALAATSADAQNLLSREKAAANVEFATKQIDIAIAPKVVSPRKLAENQMLFGYNGSNAPSSVAGFGSWLSASMIMSDLSGDDLLKDYVGYKIVGLRFTVAASLGENAAVVAAIYKGENDEGTEVSAALTSSNYKVCPSSGNQLTSIEWNEVAFDEPYTITGEETEVFYGYQYTQPASTEQKLENFPIIYGESTSTDYKNMFLIYGKPSATYSEGFFYISSAKQPFVPCFQVILQNGDDTAVIGINGSSQPTNATGYYSLDGKQLSAPQKGLNLVKMSDGTVRKVMK